MSTKTQKKTGKAQRSAIADVVAREYTIHMHKRVRTPFPADPDEALAKEIRGGKRDDMSAVLLTWE